VRRVVADEDGADRAPRGGSVAKDDCVLSASLV
jgi:hypothetical protein